MSLLLVQFIDMGFTHEHARLALLSTGSLEEATDYILTHPPPPPARVGVVWYSLHRALVKCKF